MQVKVSLLIFRLCWSRTGHDGVPVPLITDFAVPWSIRRFSVTGFPRCVRCILMYISLLIITPVNLPILARWLHPLRQAEQKSITRVPNHASICTDPKCVILFLLLSFLSFFFLFCLEKLHGHVVCLKNNCTGTARGLV